MSAKLKLISVISVLAVFTIFLSTQVFSAGPTCGTTGVCSVLTTDGNGNFGIGANSDTISRLYIKNANSSTTQYGLKIISYDGSTPVFVIRNDGLVTLASSTSFTNAGLVFPDGSKQITAFTGSTSNPVTIAGNVGAGVFGSNVGNGVFSFPATLGVATSTTTGLPQSLSVYGGGYFSGNVGIGAASPSSPLTVAGQIYSSTGGYKFPDGTTQTTAAVTAINYWSLSGNNLSPTSTAYSLGIGTASPNSPLHVVGNLSVSGNGATNGGMPGMAQITTGGTSPFLNRLTYGTDGTGYKFAISKNQTGAVTDQLIIQDNGNVGIGTAAAGSKLDVRGVITGGDGTIQTVISYAGTTGAVGTLTNHALGLYANGAERIRIDTAGNVGVGTTTPVAKLDVNGTIWTNAAGGARNAFYDLAGGHIAAGTSIYSYGPICAGNAAGDCSSTGGVVVSATGVKFPDGTTQTTAAAGVGGSGTTNYISKFTAASTLGNSTISDDGTTITANGQLDVTGGTGTAYTSAPIEVRTTSTPRISFHWPGVVASQLGMDSAGVIRTYDNPGTGYEKFAASQINIGATNVIDANRNIINVGTVVATGFTGSTVTAGGFNISGALYRTAAGKGYLDGGYPSYEMAGTSGAIYSIGGAYVPGTTTLGNMYGIGYGYSGTAGITATGAPANLWGQYVAGGGVSRIFLSGDTGSIYANGSINGVGANFSGTVTVPTPVNSTDAATKGYVDAATGVRGSAIAVSAQGAASNYATAAAYCYNLSAAAATAMDGNTTTVYNDWRLPSLEEIGIFPTAYNYGWVVWTTTAGTTANNKITYNPSDGGWGQAPVTDTSPMIRCVR